MKEINGRPLRLDLKTLIAEEFMVSRGRLLVCFRKTVFARAMSKPFQFQLSAIFLITLVAAMASAGLASVAHEQRLMALTAPIEMAAWSGLWSLPVAIVAVFVGATGPSRRKIALCLFCAWVACLLLLMAGPFTPEPP